MKRKAGSATAMETGAEDWSSVEDDQLFATAYEAAGISREHALCVAADKLGLFQTRFRHNFFELTKFRDLTVPNWTDTGFFVSCWTRSWHKQEEAKFCKEYFLVHWKEALLVSKGRSIMDLVIKTVTDREMKDPVSRTLILAQRNAIITEETIKRKGEQFQNFSIKSVSSSGALDVPVLPLGELGRSTTGHGNYQERSSMDLITPECPIFSAALQVKPFPAV